MDQNGTDLRFALQGPKNPVRGILSRDPNYMRVRQPGPRSRTPVPIPHLNLLDTNRFPTLVCKVGIPPLQLRVRSPMQDSQLHGLGWSYIKPQNPHVRPLWILILDQAK